MSRNNPRRGGNYPYYAVISWGVFHGKQPKAYYRSLASAKRDAMAIAQNGGNVNVTVVGAATREDAIAANIGDSSTMAHKVWSA